VGGWVAVVGGVIKATSASVFYVFCAFLSLCLAVLGAPPPPCAALWVIEVTGCARVRLDATRTRSYLLLARMAPIGPGGLQSGFSILRYVRRDFRKKKSGPRTPRAPGGPPVLGSLVWRAEGLPSTRNWPFR
jgi:hypothetical protein